MGSTPPPTLPPAFPSALECAAVHAGAGGVGGGCGAGGTWGDADTDLFEDTPLSTPPAAMLALVEEHGDTVGLTSRVGQPCLEVVHFRDTPLHPTLHALLAALQPCSLLLPMGDPIFAAARSQAASACTSPVDVVALPSSFFVSRAATAQQQAALQPLPRPVRLLALRALSALGHYAGGRLLGAALRVVPAKASLFLDAASAAFLETLHPQASLAAAVDRCVTRGGRDLLQARLAAPWCAGVGGGGGEAAPLAQLVLSRHLVADAALALLGSGRGPRRHLQVLRALLRAIGGKPGDAGGEREQRGPPSLPRHALPLRRLQLDQPLHLLACYDALLALREIERVLGVWLGGGGGSDGDDEVEEEGCDASQSGTEASSTVSSSSSPSPSPSPQGAGWGNTQPRETPTSPLLHTLWHSLHTLFGGEAAGVTPSELIRTFEATLSPVHVAAVRGRLGLLVQSGGEMPGQTPVGGEEQAATTTALFTPISPTTPGSTTTTTTNTNTNTQGLLFRTYRGILTPTEHKILDAFHTTPGGTRTTLLGLSFTAIADTLADIAEYSRRTGEYAGTPVSVTRAQARGLSLVAVVGEVRGSREALETFNKQMAAVNGFSATTRTRRGVAGRGKGRAARDEHTVTFQTAVLEALWQRLRASLADMGRMLGVRCAQLGQTLERKLGEGSIDASGLSGEGSRVGAGGAGLGGAAALFAALDYLVAILDLVANGCLLGTRLERQGVGGAGGCRAAFVRHVVGQAGVRQPCVSLNLQQLHNPLLSLGVVGSGSGGSGGGVSPLDVLLGVGRSPLLLMGQNNGGKTSIAKALAYAVILDGLGYPTPCSRAHCVHSSPDAHSSVVRVVARGGDTGGKVGARSSFEREVTEMHDVLEMLAAEDRGVSLVILDEPCRSTSPAEAGAVLSAVLKRISCLHPQTLVLAITHSNVVLPPGGRRLSLRVGEGGARHLEEVGGGGGGREDRGLEVDARGVELLVSLLPKRGTTLFDSGGFVDVLGHSKAGAMREHLPVGGINHPPAKRPPGMTRGESEPSARERLSTFTHGLGGQGQRAQPGIDIDELEGLWCSSFK